MESLQLVVPEWDDLLAQATAGISVTFVVGELVDHLKSVHPGLIPLQDRPESCPYLAYKPHLDRVVALCQAFKMDPGTLRTQLEMAVNCLGSIRSVRPVSKAHVLDDAHPPVGEGQHLQIY